MIFRLGCLAFLLIAGLLVPSGARAELTLQVVPLQGSRDIDFGEAQSLGPQGEPQGDTMVRQVRLVITNSNSSQRYQIFQRMNEPWKNVAGKELPLETIRFYVAESKTSGIIQVPNPTPLTLGEQELFLSDSTGSSDQLLVVYTVQVPPGQRAGDYRSTMTFRVVSQ